MINIGIHARQQFLERAVHKARSWSVAKHQQFDADIILLGNKAVHEPDVAADLSVWEWLELVEKERSKTYMRMVHILYGTEPGRSSAFANEAEMECANFTATLRLIATREEVISGGCQFGARNDCQSLLNRVTRFDALVRKSNIARNAAETNEELKELNENFVTDKRTVDLLADMTELKAKILSRVGKRPGA